MTHSTQTPSSSQLCGNLVLAHRLGTAIGHCQCAPIASPLILGVIFAAALVKAWLVALYYMHLRFERLLITALVIVPLLFFIILLGVLFYDVLLPA